MRHLIPAGGDARVPWWAWAGLAPAEEVPRHGSLDRAPAGDAIALHLAATGPGPEADGADAPPAPACVGCHHGGDDDEAPPDGALDGGGLSGAERADLMAFGAAGEAAR